MNVYDLMDAVGGEIVRGKARVRQGSKYVVIGKLDGDEMVLTEAGRAMAAEVSGTDEVYVEAPAAADGPSLEVVTEPTVELSDSVEEGQDVSMDNIDFGLDG